MKRFKRTDTRSEKIEVPVILPLNWDIQDRIQGPSGANAGAYKLCGVVCHFGGAGGGHYTSLARGPGNSGWLTFDDAAVTPVADPNPIVDKHGYIAVFQKMELSSSNLITYSGFNL